MGPLMRSEQDQVKVLPGLKACFANNLHKPEDSSFFHPMPLGIGESGAESSIYRVRRAALPWDQRDSRLLVPPMRENCKLRKRFLQVLSGKEYSHLVRFVNSR